MALNTKTFDQLVSDQANAMQGVARILLDFTDGSDFLATVQANAGNSLWLQALITALLAVARLQTSSGSDVDSFVEQFGLEREPATPAYNSVIFSRNLTNKIAVIAAGTFDLSTQGALVSSTVNGITYSVYADTSNPAYDPVQNAYIIPIGVSSATVPVVATTPGSVGNVVANQITTIASAIPFVDNVTNPDPFTNGEDQESDADLKVRFVLYLDSLSKATQQALQAAILGVPGVARYKLVENEDVTGNPYLGFFYAVVDDGSGNASPQLLGNVQSALYATRGFTIAFADYAPIPFPVNIVVHAFTDNSIPDTDVQTAVITALQNYIVSKSFDSLFAYTVIPAIIYPIYGLNNVITDVTNFTLNGGISDIQLVGRQIFVPGTITVVMNA
ncbi:MAG TPA: baseplate J/gp47 family protein [Cyclobacteriaceae bacterium]|nr:baseplate J/gp47 family protein [Cyclobacteriaceae bacterium]